MIWSSPNPSFRSTEPSLYAIYEYLPRLRQKMVLWNVFGSKERKFHALSSKTFILNAHKHTRYLPTLIHIDILYMDGVKNWQKISFDCGRFSDPEKSKSITAALLFMLLLCMRCERIYATKIKVGIFSQQHVSFVLKVWFEKNLRLAQSDRAHHKIFLSQDQGAQKLLQN